MSENGREELTFHIADYVVWSLILASSIGIGIYYACTGGRQRSTEEFLVGNREMNPIPVAMSLAVSFISAVTFLGTTAEAYSNGVMIWLHTIAVTVACIFAGVFYLPVFHRLKLTSVNEYLELRFNRACRLLGSAIVILNMFVYMGVVLYGPALALNQVAGLNVWGSVLTIGMACTFYTTIGGLKAVIWTDVFQMCIMVCGLLAVIIKGSIDLGGFSNVLRIVGEGNRLNLFEMSTDVTVRHTFWGLTIGASFMFLSIFGINQAQVQRYLSCSTVKIARISLAIAAALMVVIISSAVTAGLVMYAYYADCDPMSTGAVAKRDQMIPYFTLDLFRQYPGLPGLFLSAVFSASLSTISSGLNAVAAVTTEDLIKPLWPGLSDKRYTHLSKLMGWFSSYCNLKIEPQRYYLFVYCMIYYTETKHIGRHALSYGILTIGFAFLASVLGDILKTVLNVFGMFGGPTLGLFSVGMFFPWTNSKGAFCGTLIGLIFSFWVGIGAQVYPPSYPAPSFSTSGCTLNNDTLNLYNSTGYSLYLPDTGVSTVTELATDGATTLNIRMTSKEANDESRPAIAALYTLSYTWYAVTSWLVTIFASLIISFLTGPSDPRKLDPRLISPVVDIMYCCLPEKWKIPLRCGVGEDFMQGPEYEKMNVSGQHGFKVEDPVKKKNWIQVDHQSDDDVVDEIV
ncbi:sodium-coupled monocarboxylate transporter 1-like [Strongylocentrotus purpuratus]|uniref:Sodium-coupled monocarboxylate transporter 1 n=1 Tax=Strongylocentrotus purpuratus TaxID=7668 RepID=A0A7M7NPL2_STRPU|nr:sodium-coupled monocarboxylate transporter 1-like [Strongylocentrotus purpuratus]